MCSGEGLVKRVKESFNPAREFERSLSPEKAFKDSMEPITGVKKDIEVPDPTKPPQASKTPDPSQLWRRNKNAQGGMIGFGNTLLTSPSGVGTPATGTASLLGG